MKSMINEAGLTQNQRIQSIIAQSVRLGNRTYRGSQGYLVFRKEGRKSPDKGDLGGFFGQKTEN